MSTSLFSNGIYYALIGTGIGAIFGIGKTYSEHLFTPVIDHNNMNSIAAYKNLSLDSVAVRIINRFQLYQNLIPQEYESILSNLDKLIGIQVTVNQGQVEAYFPYRATALVTEIQSALNQGRKKTLSISVPHWDADEKAIRDLADDYLFNINHDVNSFMLKRRSHS
jgi:hypothetical protein